MNGTYSNDQPKKKLKDLRAQARNSLHGKWLLAILAMIIAVLLGAQLATTGSDGGSLTYAVGALGSEVSDFPSIWEGEETQDGVGIIGGEDTIFGKLTLPTKEDVEIFWRDVIDRFPLFSGNGSLLWIGLSSGLAVSLILSLFVGTAMRIGHLRFRLSLIDGEKGDLAKLFTGFDKSYLPAIVLRLLRTLYLFLWGLPAMLLMGIGIISLLMSLVGVWFSLGGWEIPRPSLLVGLLALLFSVGFSFLPTIASYRYAMSDYILAENPDMPVSDALRESARMMRGNKWRLFCLQLSFIGWGFLCLFSCGIGFLWLSPYIYQAEAALYHEISGREAIHDAVAGMKDLMAEL